MKFLTVREPKIGTLTHSRPLGPRGEFFEFAYEVCYDPQLERVGIDLDPEVTVNASWDYASDIVEGARVGWVDLIHDLQVRLCCIEFCILRTRDNTVDTSPRLIQQLVGRFVSAQINKWAEPIPPLRAECLTSDVVALARGIRANAALDGLLALCDALLEAGCDDPLVIEHLQTCRDHAPSCWVVEMILDQLVTAPLR